MENSTILIVDDEALGRETLHDMLISQNYRLEFASSGAECLEKAGHIQPDVVLLDVMMPEMNGFEVCQQLRQDPHLAEVPIILVTALDDRQARLAGIQAGADDFVSKPLDRVELRARLRTITRLNRYRRLQSQRAMFAWVIEQADNGYVILNNDDEISYANNKARLYLGLPITDPSQISGQFLVLAEPNYELVPPASWANWPQPALPNLPQRHLMRPESATTNLLWLRIDRMEMKGGHTEEHLIRLTDVTTEVIEERLRWSFHAQVSHKLKTPLTHLISGIDLLRNDRGDYSQEQKDSFLNLLYQSCTQLQNTMRDIFQYLEARDVIHPNQSPCSIAEMVDTIAEIQQDLNLKSVQVITQAFADIEATEVAISVRAIKLILWEILRNSQKFHPDQLPDITILLENIGGEELRIQIKDNGLMLSPKQLGQMWLPYYQAERHFTGQVPGMGLGLAVIAAIVLGIGGRYQSYNQENGPGIVVELILPLTESIEDAL